jgi:poly-gamma-glutamate capsule biosynthesis protein CapA/YwtB (metallophosphatase superfamily)
MAMSGAESGEPAAQPALPDAPAPADDPAAEPPAAVVGRAAVTPPPAAEPQVVFTVPTGEQHPAAPNLVAVGTGAERDAVGGGHGLPGAVAGAALRDWLAERPSRLAGIVGSQPHRPRGLSDRLRGRTNLLIMALVGLLAIGLATGAMVLTSGNDEPGDALPPIPLASDSTAPAATASPSAEPSAGVVPPPGADQTISMSATGDIIMGSAPNSLPPAGGRDFFNQVRSALRADLQMGNLEQPLTNDTGVTKCGAQAADCFAFRSPPSYANVLRDAGFRVLNLANNHAYDFGAEGNRQTRAALEGAGLAHTGAPGQITVVEVKGVKVAVLGFSSYSWSQSVIDIDAGAALVRQAKTRADLVVVQMHVGAEGADRSHVKPGTEMYLGENRGDSIKFAHAVVDAGADLVVGHGPHVMRAMEFYKGRLIAYSLGNFAGYKALGYTGVVGVGGVLHVTLRRDGSYVGGSLTPTKMVAPGLPATDPARQALSLVRGLSDADLPTSGARIGDDGSITPRA